MTTSPDPSPASRSLISARMLVIAGLICMFGFGYRVGQRYPEGFWQTRGGESARTSTLPSATEASKLDINDKQVDFDLLWEVWSKLETKFVDRKNLAKSDLVYGAIKGVAAAAKDNYTFFLTPEENKQSKDSLGGRFEGIGAQLGTRDGLIVVVAPISGSPAEAAGVRAGDIIIEVDGKSIKGQAVSQVVSVIRGPAGTDVTIKVFRKDSEKTFTIKRAQIQTQIFEVKYEGTIAHVKMNQFGEKSIEEWRTIASDLEQKYRDGTVTGVALDVRGNPGGFLDAAVYMASDFLPFGELVLKEEFADRDHEIRVSRNGILQRIPLVVLIDRGSASASEILAGSLRDHKRASLVGEKSFGKGSVQEVMDLSGGSGLHVTVAKWILPGGDWIHGKGIVPEFEVKNDELDADNTLDVRSKDKQLDKAIEMLKNK